MRTPGLRVHLTSLTLILVITVSGQEGVSGVRDGLYFCLLQVGDYTGADVDSWPALEKTPPIQYFIICSYFDTVFPQRK